MLMKDIEWASSSTGESISQTLRRVGDGTGPWRLYRSIDDKLYYFMSHGGVGVPRTYLLPPDIHNNYDLFEAACMLAEFEPYHPTTEASHHHGGQGDPVA